MEVIIKEEIKEEEGIESEEFVLIDKNKVTGCWSVCLYVCNEGYR